MLLTQQSGLFNRLARSIPFSIVFASISIMLLIPLIILGMPKVGVGLAVPWLSVLLIQRPGMLLAAYLYIPFYKSVTLEYAPVDLTVWLASLCIATFIYHTTKRRAIPVSVSMMLWVLLCVVVVSATAVSIDPEHSLFSALNFVALSFIPLFLAIHLAQSPILVNQFLRFTFWASIVYSAIGMITLLGTNVGRLELSANTIGTGRAAMLAVLLAPIVIPRSPGKPIFVAVSVSLGLVVTLATGSRGPLIFGLLAMVVVYAVWSKWFAVRLLLVVTAALLSVASLYSHWIESLIPEASLWRIRSLIDAALGAGELDRSSSARVDLFDHAIQMWSARPVFGMGPGSFDITADLVPAISTHTYPHNALFQAGAELGTVGFSILVVMILWSLVNSLGRIHDPGVKGVAILTIFSILSAMVSNDLYDNRWMWGMLLLAGSLGANSQPSNSDEQNVASSGQGSAVRVE